MIYMGDYKTNACLCFKNMTTTFNLKIKTFDIKTLNKLPNVIALISHYKTFIFMILISLFFIGCNSKKDVVVEYKEVYIPTKCNEQMPIKPQLNNNDLESVKALAEYYVECEIKLKSCLGIN